MEKIIYNISKEFSRHPGGRDLSDGPHSGEQFRDEVLRPMLDSGAQVVLQMDGTRGFPPSFLEETFGGLVRLGFGKERLLKDVEIETTTPLLKEEILGYIDSAESSRNK